MRSFPSLLNFCLEDSHPHSTLPSAFFLCFVVESIPRLKIARLCPWTCLCVCMFSVCRFIQLVEDRRPLDPSRLSLAMSFYHDGHTLLLNIFRSAVDTFFKPFGGYTRRPNKSLRSTQSLYRRNRDAAILVEVGPATLFQPARP